MAGRGPARLPIPVGERFGRLTVLATAPDRGGRPAYRCRCECGTETEAAAHALRAGSIRSCGCGKRKRHKPAANNHRRTEYSSWAKMKRVAKARRISIYPSWAALHGFEAFLDDMGARPDGLVLGRLDRTAGYSPENCRWVAR